MRAAPSMTICAARSIRFDLDEAVRDRPVLVQHRGGHTAFVNSLAFQLAQVNDQTPDPAGGRFEHDAAGHLTGFVGDAAAQVFFKLIPDKNTRQDYRQGAALISKLFTGKGITSACDADASPEDVQGYQYARDAGGGTFRFFRLLLLQNQIGIQVCSLPFPYVSYGHRR